MGKSTKALADELKAVWARVAPGDEPDHLISFFSLLMAKQLLRKGLLKNLDNVFMKQMIVFAARLFNLIELPGFGNLLNHLNTLTFQQTYAKVLAIDSFRSRGYKIDLEAPKGSDFVVVFGKSMLNVKAVTFSEFPDAKAYLNKVGKKRRKLSSGRGNLMCVVFPEVTEANLDEFTECWRHLGHAAERFTLKTSRVDFVANVTETIEIKRDPQGEQIIDLQMFSISRGLEAADVDEHTLLSLVMGDASFEIELPPTSHPFETFFPWIGEILDQRSGKDKWWTELAPGFQEQAKRLGWGPVVDEVVHRFNVNVEWLSRYAERPLEIEFKYLKAGVGRLVNASSTTVPKDLVTIYDTVEPVFRNFFRYAMATSPSFLGFEFLAPAIAPPTFATDGPTDVSTRFRSLPEVKLDAVRERYAHALQVAAWDIITLHEVGHIYSGHNDLKRSRIEAGDPLTVDEIRALEIDADAFAVAGALEIWRHNGMKFLGPTEDMVRLPWFEEKFGENGTGYHIALTAYCCVVRLDLDTEWSLESKTDVHPAPPVRRIHNLFTALLHMQKSFPWFKECDMGAKHDYVFAPMAQAEELYRRVNRMPIEPFNFLSDGAPEIEQLRILVERRDGLLEQLEPYQRGRRMVTVS